MRGRCLCGAVAFELQVAHLRAYRCHCSLCRRQSGGASNLAAIVPAERFAWLTGAASVASWTRSTGYRSDVCPTCGSPVPNALRQWPAYWVPIGSLDEPASVDIVAEFCLSSRAGWDAQPLQGRAFADIPDLKTFLAVVGGAESGPVGEGRAAEPPPWSEARTDTAAGDHRQRPEAPPMPLHLRQALPGDFAALQQLLELYQYELSDLWHQEADADAKYGYDLERHKVGARFHAHVALAGSQHVGFALVAPAAVTRQDGHWMEQFFILKRHRRTGAGSALARHVLYSHPGPWEIGQIPGNAAARAFWRHVVTGVTGGAFVELELTQGWWQGVVQQFDVRPGSADRSDTAFDASP